MHIGELSRHTGVSARSIRHYDDNGLLGARHGENGDRIFDEAAVRRVLRIALSLRRSIDARLNHHPATS